MSDFHFNQSELNSLYKYCYVLVNDRDQAYDLLYSGIEKYLRRLPNEVKAKNSYICCIIRNLWIDNYRKKTPVFESITPENQDKAMIYVLEDMKSFEDELISQQELDFVWKKMSAEEREIMFLWVIERLSMDEISTFLKISRNTIVSKIYRMRNRFRKENDVNNRRQSKIGKTVGE